MRINVIVNGKKICLTCTPGQNLAQLLVTNGLMEGISCGRGICRKCAIRHLSGELLPIHPGENIHNGLPEGYILACRSMTGNTDLEVEISVGRDEAQRKSSLFNTGKWRREDQLPVKKFFLKMDPPTLTEQLSDLERVINALGHNVSMRPGLLTHLPSLLRKAGFEVTATIINNELAVIEAGDTRRENYGFVVDIGTTTIAAYLLDLTTGQTIDAEGIANPQRSFGADVLSRISAASEKDGREKLQNLVLEGISQTFKRLLTRNNISSGSVYRVIIVGNTTMTHMLMGLECYNLAVSPFIPCVRKRVALKGRDLDLPVNPEASIQILANISGYLGSDILGVVMATRPWEIARSILAVDIGTNGEMFLAHKGRIYACSTAAGPAFEGAHIEMGMRAGEGAIEKVSLAEGTPRLWIIGNTFPTGICGSGIIDAVAELLKTGLLDRTGKFIKNATADSNPALSGRLRINSDGIREFVLAYAGEYGSKSDIVITQKDIREIQMAKAAIAAGIAILYRAAGIQAEQVDCLFLAGAFGNYIDRKNASVLGLFPGIPVEKIIPVGNAAAEGAAICLLSSEELLNSDKVALSISPIELSTSKEFNSLWIKCLDFPELENA